MPDGNPTNLLYYGDNLDILRRYVKDESVDLIYLDPPSTRIRATTCCSKNVAAECPMLKFTPSKIRGNGAWTRSTR